MENEDQEIIAKAQKLYAREELYVYDDNFDCLTPYWDTGDWLVHEKYCKLMSRMKNRNTHPK